MLKYHIHSDVFDPGRLGENHIDRIQMEMIPDGGRILEIGCASGYMSTYLRGKKGCHVTGVEAHAEAAAVAAGRCDRFVPGDILDPAVQVQIDALVAETTGFDIVFMSQVIEHIARPEALLQRFHAWLAPGGSLLVSTCNVAHWRSRLRLLRGKWHYDDYGIFDRDHLRFFTPASFAELLGRCGYRVVAEGYSFEDICPFKLLFDRRLIAPSDLLRIVPFYGKRLRRAYIYRMRNLISTQFAYRAVPLADGAAALQRRPG
jgi:2-polyprenyl-3-methyl-5-hydroxy-6-metoxy-1,4-benzoquinol methylase